MRKLKLGLTLAAALGIIYLGVNSRPCLAFGGEWLLGGAIIVFGISSYINSND